MLKVQVAELKQSVSPKRQHGKFGGTQIYAFLAFIAFIALGAGAAAAAFFAPFFAMLIVWGGEVPCGMQVSSRTSFLEPDQERHDILDESAHNSNFHVALWPLYYPPLPEAIPTPSMTQTKNTSHVLGFSPVPTALEEPRRHHSDHTLLEKILNFELVSGPWAPGPGLGRGSGPQSISQYMLLCMFENTDAKSTRKLTTN